MGVRPVVPDDRRCSKAGRRGAAHTKTEDAPFQQAIATSDREPIRRVLRPYGRDRRDATGYGPRAMWMGAPPGFRRGGGRGGGPAPGGGGGGGGGGAGGGL